MNRNKRDIIHILERFVNGILPHMPEGIHQGDLLRKMCLNFGLSSYNVDQAKNILEELYIEPGIIERKGKKLHLSEEHLSRVEESEV